jgi:Icc-related predicted phosphoesterase
MGFDYSQIACVDPVKHKFFGGNHDNYDTIGALQRSLGKFGNVNVGGLSFFFIRGAFSIDKYFRTPGYDYFYDEELTSQELEDAKRLYCSIKPDLVLTHDAPRAIVDIISSPGALVAFGVNPETFQTRTQNALQDMIELHQPKKWVFGHFHQSVVVKYKGCEFQCLNELETLEIT